MAFGNVDGSPLADLLVTNNTEPLAQRIPRRVLIVIKPSRKYSSRVIYAVMPDVFAPYWCVQVEPVRHERRWPIKLFAYPIMKRRR